MKLLCQLWALNESLQEYKKALEDDEDTQREATGTASILESHLEELDEELTEEMEDLEEDPKPINELIMPTDHEEEPGYSLPHNSRIPLPTGPGPRALMSPNDPGARRRLPNRPQMPIFPQGQRALPGTNHIYGNLMPSLRPAGPVGPPGPGYISGPGPRVSTPNSAFLTNLANKRIMNNTATNLKR